MRRDFYYQDDRSNKFWTVEVVDRTCITTHGRIGSTPRETRNEFPTQAAAERELERLISSKLKKGYIEGSLDEVPEYVTPVSYETFSNRAGWHAET